MTWSRLRAASRAVQPLMCSNQEPKSTAANTGERHNFNRYQLWIKRNKFIKMHELFPRELTFALQEASQKLWKWARLWEKVGHFMEVIKRDHNIFWVSAHVNHLQEDKEHCWNKLQIFSHYPHILCYMTGFFMVCKHLKWTLQTKQVQ